eukprot:5750540-Alexandrium_andersonii.AAC.1
MMLAIFKAIIARGKSEERVASRRALVHLRAVPPPREGCSEFEFIRWQAHPRLQQPLALSVVEACVALLCD